MKDYTFSIIVVIVLLLLMSSFIYNCDYYNPQNGNSKERKNKLETFFGGYYYPYDYPYYWPYFYSGCNENVFGQITCLPFTAHPFW